MRRPSRTINTEQKLVVRRMLPGLGEILVQRGQQVGALETVARAELPSRYEVINVARQLRQPDVDMDAVMLKEVGEAVKEGEEVAHRKTTFGKRVAYAAAKGFITAIGPGWVLVETERTVTQVQAFVEGQVSRVIANRGVVLEAHGTLVEAACGFGGEAHGVLRSMVDKPSDFIEPDDLDIHSQNTVVLAGHTVDEAVLRQAEERGVRGLIVSSLDASLLDLEPRPKVSVVATEGFGQHTMSWHTFNILRHLNGRELSMRGTTPSLDGPNALGIQPEPPLILAVTGKPSPSEATEQKNQAAEDLAVDVRVRVVGGPFLGTIGKIEAFPPEPQTTESGILIPGAYLTIDQRRQYIPLVNLERVE